MNIFGNKEALIGSLELGVGAAFVLGALVFRKSIANDMLDRGFSVIGSSLLGIVAFLILSNVFDNLKLTIGLSVFVWLAGGFLLADLIQDGEGGN